MRMRRAWWMAWLIWGLMGCGAPQPARKDLAESVRLFNQSVHWKNWGQARGFLAPEMGVWFKRQMLSEARHAEWAVMSITQDGEAGASVILQRRFYTDTNTTLQTALIEQTWRREPPQHIWMVIKEAPFDPEAEPAEVSKPAEVSEPAEVSSTPSP